MNVKMGNGHTVLVAVSVRVVGGANIVHLVGGTALHAAGHGFLAGQLGGMSYTIMIKG